MIRYLLPLFCTIALHTSPPPQIISVAGGVFNVLRSNNKAAMVQLEYKGIPFWGKEHFFIRPMLTAMGTFQGSLFAAGGIAFDIPLGTYAFITPSFATGFYVKNGGKDLGYPIENRSAIEISAAFKRGYRLGFQFYHLSNGSLSRTNPGAECLLLQLSIPIN
ncbi:MAG: acyloxyacyl hydrolase [Simkaniaceae bacterium]|nr:acyloxyacyl hydrolase [Simkaniaceae bacterium]